MSKMESDREIIQRMSHRPEEASSIIILRAGADKLEDILKKIGAGRTVDSCRALTGMGGIQLETNDSNVTVIYVTENLQEKTILIRGHNAPKINDRTEQTFEEISHSKYIIANDGQLIDDFSSNKVDLQHMVNYALGSHVNIMQLSVHPSDNSAFYDTVAKCKEEMAENGMNSKIVASVAGLAAVEYEYLMSLEKRLSVAEFRDRKKALEIAFTNQEGIFDLADVIVVNSEVDRFHLQKLKDGKYTTKTVVINPSYDTKINPENLAPGESCRREWKGKSFSFVGDLSSYGGLDVILAAFYSLRRQNPEIHLILAGEKLDEEAFGEAFLRIEKQGLIHAGQGLPKAREALNSYEVDNIHIFESDKDNNNFDAQIYHGDFTIVPRTGSYFPRMILESMRLGIPVICHNAEAITKLNTSRDNICFNYARQTVPEDVALMQMMDYCLQHPEEAQRVAESALAFKRASWIDHATEEATHLKLYYNLVPALSAHALTISIARPKQKQAQ